MPLAISQKTFNAVAVDVAQFEASKNPTLPIRGGGDIKPVNPPSIDTAPVEFEANISPPDDCYRLVHDGSIVIALFQAVGTTMTRNNLFCGTLDECNAEISAQGLDRTAYDAAEAARKAARQPSTPLGHPRPPGGSAAPTRQSSVS